MINLRSLLLSWTLAALVLSPLAAQDRREIVLKTKAVTALVDVGAIGSATAFCIDEQGLFLTNYHVVGQTGLGNNVKLIINPSLETERTIQARFIKYDVENDLALLQAKPGRKWNALTLGDATKLVETDPVTAFGYPFGRMLSQKPGGYPSISINLGRVSALRRNEGKLKLLQIDAAVNPGNSGGPVLNDAGEVVGVVVSGISESGVNFCIPSNIIREFLSTPAVVLEVPQITFSNLSRELTFDFEVVPLAVKEPLKSAELILQYAGEETEPATAQKSGKQFRSTARFNLPEEFDRFHVRVRRGEKLTEFSTGDLSFSVGPKSFHLSDVRRLDKRGKRHIVVANNSHKLIGTLSNLEPLAKAASLSVDELVNAERIDVFCEKKAPEELSYRLVLKGESSEWPEISGAVPVYGVPLSFSDSNQWFDRYSDSLDEVLLRLYVDGEDRIHVRDNGIELEHVSYGKPGFKDGHGKYILVNGEKWYPDWYYSSADSNDEDESDKHPLKLGGGNWKMTVLKQLTAKDHRHNPKRGKVSVEEHNIGMSITITDQSVGGGIYEILLKKHLVPQESTEPPTGPAKGGEWNFEDVEEHVVADVSGNGHAGQIHGLTHYVPSPVGQGLRFAGGTALPAGPHFNTSHDKPFSVSVWIKPEKNGAVSVSQMKSGGTWRGFDILTDRNTIMVHLIHQWPGNALRVWSERRLPMRKWTHVAVTYDGSQQADGLHIFYDGRQVPERITHDALQATTQNELPLLLGGRLTDYFWQGAIDEVRLYDRVLTDEEIQALADPKRQTEASLEQGLQVHWAFEDAHTGEIRPTTGQADPVSLEKLPRSAEIVDGRDGKVLQLRKGGFVDCGQIGNFERDQSFSLGGWIKVGEKGKRRQRFAPIGKMEPTGPKRGYRFLVDLGGVIKFHLLHQAGQSVIEVDSTERFPVGEWHHVMVTYDGSSKAAGVTLYIDGKAVPTKTVSDKLNGTIKTAEPLLLGNGPTTSHGSGQLDDMIVIDRLLSAEEVAELAGAGQPAATKPE